MYDSSSLLEESELAVAGERYDGAAPYEDVEYVPVAEAGVELYDFEYEPLLYAPEDEGL